MARDVLLISISRCVRTFIFTYIALISPYFLSSIGLGVTEIALVIFASVFVATLYTLLLPRIPKSIRFRLVLPSALLSTGLVLLLFLHSLVWFMVSIAISGIAISGKDQSANRPMEQYLIGSYKKEQRFKNTAFSRYNFLSYIGAFTAALLVFLELPGGYFDIFILLALCSFVPLLINLSISAAGHEDIEKPPLDEATKGIVSKMVPLFMLDSFGGGMISQSLLTLWFKQFYSVAISTVGLIFLVAELITAFSVLVSSKISTRFGLVNTMVATHILSSVFLILILVVPLFAWSLAMLYLRQGFSEMDVPARDSLVNSIIEKRYRIRTNSILQSSKYVSTIPGPIITAQILSVAGLFVLPVAGMIKVTYDLIFYGYFRHSEQNSSIEEN